MKKNMASFGTKDNNSIIIKDSMVASTDSLTQKQDSARKSRNHEEKLRQVKDRQNEERQRKLEELKAQALAAQKYREQIEEERKRRIDEMKLKENDKRQQVEDRKKAIMDAERERREYIVRKNQERDAKLDTKRRNERSSISFAFGSSTPRLLDPVEVSLVSPNVSYWGHRRSTSTSNVSYGGNAIQLSRRSSERELSDGAKKRATSAGGLDRPDDLHKMSTSMYEVFNWGHVNESRPKRLSLFAGASEINIDDPAPVRIITATTHSYSRPHDESIESSPFVIRSVARRKTDLMPTIPIRDSNFGSRTSLYCSTPRTQDFKNRGRAVSMTRLDQLAQPTRRKGEHIRAVIERERKQHIEESLAAEKATKTRKMSRSLTHLSSGSSIRSPAPLRYSLYQSGRNSSTPYSAKSSILSRPLRKSNATKSMTQLVTAKLLCTSKSPAVIEARKAQTKHDNDIEIDSRTTNVSVAGSRSGEVTPGGSSRPGSAMSISTTASGVVYRRSTTTRKPRPASIASGMSMSVDSPEALKALNKKDKPTSRPSSAIRRSSSNTTGNLVNGSSTSNSPRTPSATTNKTTKRPEKRVSAKKIPTVSRAVETPKLASSQTETVPTDIVPYAPSDSIVKKTKTVQTTEKVEQVTSSNNDDLISTEPTTTTTNTTEQQNVEQELTQKVVEIVKVVESKEVKPEPEMANGDRHSIESNKTIDFENIDMTASMIQRRIRSEDEAKAALAERRRKVREEAERQAQLEKQRDEEERQLQLKLQAEEEERQRLFELEALRLVEEQRRAEEERLQKAIEEAQKREEEERARKEVEEKARIEREEQEQKAREEAERQKVEVAERLKREEKEREERRKRVEAIMSRTRANTAAAAAANNTPNKSEDVPFQQTSNNESTNNTSANNIASIELNDSNRKSIVNDYEKSVTDKENALIHTFSNLIENKPSAQHIAHHAENNSLHNNTKTNGKLLDFTHSLNDDHINDIAKTPISNGNGHPLISNLDKKIDSDLISNQLLDLSLDSSQRAEHTVNFNNNSLISSAPLVTSDSHEAKEISLL